MNGPPRIGINTVKKLILGLAITKDYATSLFDITQVKGNFVKLDKVDVLFLSGQTINNDTLYSEAKIDFYVIMDVKYTSSKQPTQTSTSYLK